MASVYKVTEIEGKGLGCVATVDIEKGSLILTENPQICGNTEEKEGNSKWIKSLLKSFKRIKKADQHEYMALHNKYNNFQDSQNVEYHGEQIELLRGIMERDINNWKLEICKIEQNPEKAAEILKICCIYSTNSFPSGVRIKTSRFNHSCEGNATTIIMLNDEKQIRAISNIKAGREINITYNSDPFSGFRNKEFRQMSLLLKWFFMCSCDLCKNGVDIDTNASEVLIQEAEKLAKDRKSALEAGPSRGPLYYSLEKCKTEVSLYKKMYKVGKTQKIQPLFLYRLLDRAFDTASFGYQLYKDADLKMDAVNFAKASEKFGKILGNAFVTRGKPNYWKEIYQNYERWLQIPTLHK
jgi:hypothetical protein